MKNKKNNKQKNKTKHINKKKFKTCIEKYPPN